MILAKYLSAESVKRRSEKPPLEREREEHVERQKTLKLAESTAFVWRIHSFCRTESDNSMTAWRLYPRPGVVPSSSASAMPPKRPLISPNWTSLS